MNNTDSSKQTQNELPDTQPDNLADVDHLPPAALPSVEQPQRGLVMHDTSLHGDANSFPVLKAFQDYLEMERQQARKRMVTLTVFFASLMALVVAGFIIAFVYTFGKMSKREERLMDVALQEKKDAEAFAPALASLTAQQVAKDFHAVALNLQTNLGAQLALMDSAATNLNSKVDAQNAEMVKLRESLAALQKENASILTNLPKLALEAARKITPPPAALPALPPAAAPPSRPSTGTVSPATTTAGTPAAATGKSPKDYDEAVVIIHSHDSDSNIPWRTFVPK